MLEPYLEDLENRLNPEVEEALEEEWREFIEGRFKGALFIPKRLRPMPAGIEWPEVTTNEGLDDYDRMALQQFGRVSKQLAAGTGEILSVRANYGTSILPSLFGAELFRMEDKLDTLPTNKPLPGGTEAIQTVLERGTPEINAGLFEKSLEMARRYRNLAKRYPKIGRYVYAYHPDFQGPMDVCELLWGSEIFLALIDTPDLVKQLLALVTELYIACMRAWNTVEPPKDGYSVHWSMLQRGQIMLRDDSAMNLSPETFAEFIRPYDERLLRDLGGGAIHFCGRGDHYIKIASEMKGLYAVNLSQPEYNDMEAIFRNTADKGIMILGLEISAGEEAVNRGRDLRGRVHCW